MHKKECISSPDPLLVLSEKKNYEYETREVAGRKIEGDEKR